MMLASKSALASAYLVVAAAIGVLASPAIVEAQQRWPITLEVALGATRGFSNNADSYRGDQSGLFVNLFFGGRLHSSSSGGAFVAMDLAAQAINVLRTADCLLTPEGGCVPWYPGFSGASLLAGWESKSSALRFLIGPGIVSADSDRALSLTGRADTALPVFWRVSLTSTLTTIVVPSWNSGRFANVALSVGLRLR